MTAELRRAIVEMAAKPKWTDSGDVHSTSLCLGCVLELIDHALPDLLAVADAARAVLSQALDHDDFVLIHRSDWSAFRAALTPKE